jgi:peptidoglycan/xylan/chitin deacetylase (PgdA/CDA1 family)
MLRPGAFRGSHPVRATDEPNGFHVQARARGRDAGRSAYAQECAAASTVVSLTFDDALSNQYSVRAMLARHSLNATFFVNTSRIDRPGHLTWRQLVDLALDGNEVGGHSLDHVDLTKVTPAEAERQVGQDRQVLMSHGFTVQSFAYPFGARDESLYSMIEACGYLCARRAWGLAPAGLGRLRKRTRTFETLPPENLFAIRAVPSSWHTLRDLQRVVTRAEAAPRHWVPIVFHHVTPRAHPGGYSVAPATLNAFLEWLAARSGSGTYVHTIGDVVSQIVGAASLPSRASVPGIGARR